MIKPGINKPIHCRKCGHKVGVVTLKWRFKFKLILVGFLVGLLMQIPAQIIADVISKSLLGLKN